MIIPRYSVDIRLKELLNIRKGLHYYNLIRSDHILFFNSCSEAITFYLMELSKVYKKKLTVGVPLYACWSIFHSVFSSSNDIKFLDINLNDDAFNIDQMKSENLDVLIIIHYFGIKCGYVDKIKKYFPNLIVIEDCSHVSLKRKIDVQSSNISVYSFNFHKPITAGGGGALIFNNENNRDTMCNAYSSLPIINKARYPKIFIVLLMKNYGYHPFLYSLLFKMITSERRINKNKPEPLFPHKISGIAKYLLGNQYYKTSMHHKKQYLNIPLQFRVNVDADEVENMSYFPLFFKKSVHRNTVMRVLTGMHIDCFVLWENAMNKSKFYGNTECDKFKETEKILSTILFLPELLLHDKKFYRVVELLQINSLDQTC